MEILSTGEKIKRARIYKGYTLKDLCEDKISVSKMSCIENDKMEPEAWIIDIISKKLNVDKDYLYQGIREQISQGIAALEAEKNSKILEQSIIYYLGFAEKYNYFDLCIELIHMMFISYLNINEFQKLQSLTSKYYDYCQKSHDDENYLIYNMDMAKFLYTTREFSQAAAYYNNIKMLAREKEKLNILARATYNEAACFLMLGNHERAYEVAVRLEELVDYLEGDISKAEVFQMLAILSLSMDKGKFKEFEEKSYELYGTNIENKAMAIYNYASTLFEVNIKNKALEYINNALSIYPKNNKKKLVRFMLLTVDELFNNNILDAAQAICDDALNYAISLNEVHFIEKAYYLKSRILQKLGNSISAEMYMNLSLDALLKFGGKQDIQKRFIEMGYMYYKLKQIKESIKYFNLSISLEKKM
ncbi:helix-turn-helix domain-containing protein [Candidatus Clostridium stratigraminis]|uniref:Helix-turn-helix domain-containing protein n=1 Tax=Candidatus Clostridium stratigraminis TaxID=3381661 RepID=A0ABW8T3D6_9CLOT